MTWETFGWSFIITYGIIFMALFIFLKLAERSDLNNDDGCLCDDDNSDD